MLAGHIKGKKTSLSSMFEAVGAYTANKITAEELAEFETRLVRHAVHVRVCTPPTV